jgi:hypothetical protein
VFTKHIFIYGVTAGEKWVYIAGARLYGYHILRRKVGPEKSLASSCTFAGGVSAR